MAAFHKNFWLIYNINTLSIHGRFYLEKDAKKKARKLLRRGIGPLSVEWLGETTEAQWKLWKVLQS